PSVDPNVTRLPTFSARKRIAPMPIATKMPTHRSTVERPRFTRPPRSCGVFPAQRNSAPWLADARPPRSRYPPEHEHREHEVEREDRERALDDGARGGARHALGRRIGIEALEHGDHADGHAEDDALDDAVHDVVAEIDGCLHVAPERSSVDVDQAHADE